MDRCVDYRRERRAPKLWIRLPKNLLLLWDGGSLVMDATLLIPSIKAGKMTRTTDGWIGTYL